MVDPAPPPEPLPLRWAVILLAAALVAAIVGGLTAVHADAVSAALAALGAGGVTVPTAHKLLP